MGLHGNIPKCSSLQSMFDSEVIYSFVVIDPGVAFSSVQATCEGRAQLTNEAMV